MDDASGVLVQSVRGARSTCCSFPTRDAMGSAAAADIAEEIAGRLARQASVRMIFAAAPANRDADALATAQGIDWRRVEAFQMDEYLGLPERTPELFANWLGRQIFDRVPFGEVHPLDPERDPGATARSYAAKLEAAPIDMVCLGIGMNGHLAFNDPPVADFDDPFDVKVVELDRSAVSSRWTTVASARSRRSRGAR